MRKKKLIMPVMKKDKYLKQNFGVKEKSVLISFLKEKELKLTKQREDILVSFLKTEEHLSIEDLYSIVKKKNSSIGQATVFRTLKLLSAAGIAREIDLGDKRMRFEHGYNHSHHDHIVCIKCHTSIEAVDPEIEKRQSELCKKFGFTPTSHRLEIFGICKDCNKEFSDKEPSK